MRSRIRTFNYTGRQLVKLTDIELKLYWQDENLHPQFAIERLDFDTYELPASARVILEARKRSEVIIERIDAGTVESVNIEKMSLEQFSRERIPQFTLKIVSADIDRGKILARSARDFTPVNPLDKKANVETTTLLHMLEEDLGGSIFEMEFPADGYQMPRLVLNSLNIPDLKNYILNQSCKWGVSLIYPSVLRETLNHILITLRLSYDRSREDWPNLWLRWAHELTEEEPPKAIDAADYSEIGVEYNELARQWIEKSVRAFCDNQQMYRKLESVIQDGGVMYAE